MNNRPIRGKMAHKAGYASGCGSVVIDQNVPHLNSSHTAAWLVALNFKLWKFTCSSDVRFRRKKYLDGFRNRSYVGHFTGSNGHNAHKPVGNIKVSSVNQDPVTWLVDLNAVLIEIYIQFADTLTY